MKPSGGRGKKNASHKSLKLVIFVLLVFGAALAVLNFSQPPQPTKTAAKLYWFIPDGLRAEPDVFRMYEWAEEGKLPNIKWMMDNGAYGYSIPDFPSHTPVNFASLLTGAHPVVHGVADGPMHIEGRPLNAPAIMGFDSRAKKVAPIWTILENASKKVVLLSIPGSTPPELKNGITIRGRWGGWGFDTPAINYESFSKLSDWKQYGRAFRLFYLGQPLTVFLPSSAVSPPPAGIVHSQLTPKLVKMPAYGTQFTAYLTGDSAYSYAEFFVAGANVAQLRQGETSGWFPVQLRWNNQTVDSQVRFTLIKLEPDGTFRIRLFFNNVNAFITQPAEVAAELTAATGPMVDFVDNWPNQLTFEPEDKQVFFDEAMDSLAWHRNATAFIFQKYAPDVFIQDTYTPNQFLEARWWHRYIDPNNPDYDPAKADAAWADILKMYQGIDAIIGEARKNAGPDTMIVLSSDHGVAPLYKQVKLNNLFAQKGWLSFKSDSVTGEPIIDWNRSKVIFLKMNHVYVNPAGLGGNYQRGSGAEYEALREEVRQAMLSLRDANGMAPIVSVSNGEDASAIYPEIASYEDAPSVFNLPSDRVGDLVFEQKIGYQTIEEMDDGPVFIKALASGYKQAIDPNDKSMWTPFIAVGPNIKKGFQLTGPISHVDQMPTILSAMNVTIPSYVQGRVLSEIFT